MLPYIRNASRLALDIYQDKARARVEQDGYTRVDPFQIAGDQGVPVILRPMDKLLGAFLRENVSGILVNSERPAGLIHMTCAHELGHYFMGHNTTADDTMDFGPRADRREREADWFAYQLLASRQLLATVLRRKRLSIQALKNPLAMYQLSLRLGISYTAAAWSMVRQGLMVEETAKSLLRVSPADIKQSLLGESPFDPRKDVWVLDETDQDSVIEPRADDQILIRLKSNSAAGYLWSVNELASEGFQVRPLSSTSPIATRLDEVVFGATQLVDFVVTSPKLDTNAEGDIVQLSMREERPWLGKESAINAFEAKAEFESMKPGLTRAARQILLAGA